MSPRAAAGVLSGIVLAIGLIVGFIPHTLPAPPISTSGDVHCGSAFAPDHTDAEGLSLANDMIVGSGGPSGVYADYEAQCSSALGGPRTFGLLLVGIGALGGLFVLLTAGYRRQPAAASPAAEPPATEPAADQA